MNEKNIRIKLHKIHKDFVNSITDEHVKNLINNNSIITGGAITSLLLKEKVNDIDYYFTDKETVLAVANYFVKKFIDNKKDINIIPTVYEDEIDNNRVRIKIKSSGIAGINTNDKEYQYYEALEDNNKESEEYTQDSVRKELEEADKIKQDSLNQEQKYQPVYLTDNAITLSGGIQIVIRFYGEPKKIHENFDFIHCTNYWTSEHGNLY